MRLRFAALLCCIGPAILGAQAPAPLQPAWDMSGLIGELGAHAASLLPALDKVDTQAWIAKGASETYTEQLQTAKDQAKAMSDAAKELARNPEKLSACLELFFRMQSVEQMIGSLVEGVRKYQDEALAGELAALVARNGRNRNRFQAYIVDLATEREQQCAVMDREAQRCRSIVATQPPPRAGTGRKK
jgi:hypothetical protein